MKKQINYIFIIVLFPILTFGQSEENRVVRDVGFNMGYLVRNLLRNDLTTSNKTNRNFLFSYKKITGNKASRFGLSFQRIKLSNNFQGDRNLRLDLRYGYEIQKKIDDKWQLNRGIDLTNSFTSFGDNFNDNPSYNWQSGFVPFIGIQYNINPRVHLSTEAGLGFFYVIKKNFFTVTGVALNQINGSGGVIQLQVPQELILSISF